MATSGFDATLSGVSVGSVTGLLSLSFGARTVNTITYTTLDSRAAKHKEGGYEDGPLVAEIVYDKTLYDALQDNQEAHVGDTWTGTDADGDTFAGSGYITGIGEVVSNADNILVHSLEITPDTVWTHTAVS